MMIRVSRNVIFFTLIHAELISAGDIYQYEHTQKVGSKAKIPHLASHFYKYKGNSEKYKGKSVSNLFWPLRLF